MTHAEFEEREFETPLYQQLKISNNNVWSPGQVLEHHVGFDYSALCVDSYFWALHGLREPLDGLLLEALFRRRMWRRRELDRPLPDFSLNLFLQAKRPEVRKRLTSPLKATAIRAPFWRISIVTDQQQTLEALSNATSGTALVCYATPAFDRLTQLYAHTTAGTIVANSSFPQASWLRGHDAWNYDKPGAIGVANAEPRIVDGPSLDAQIETLISGTAGIKNRGYELNLKTLAKAMTQVAERSDEPASARGALFFQRAADVDSLIDAIYSPQYREPIRSYLQVLAFTATYGLLWHVVARG